MGDAEHPYGGFEARPKGLYPLVDGILHADLLPADAAFALSAGERLHLEPFVGITTDGTARQGLYQLTPEAGLQRPAVQAALDFVQALEQNQRNVAVLPMDSPDWRLWTNAFATWAPKGVLLERISETQRELALAVIETSLSTHGYDLVRRAMRLNGHLGELVDDYRDTLREFMYWFTIFGEPAPGAAWGWKLMGHHIDLHCIFVGDDLVFAPVFLGAEPTYEPEHSHEPHAFDEETERGLALRRSLRQDQAEQAVLSASVLSNDLPPELAGPFNGRHLAGAGADNLVLPNEGLSGDQLDDEQRGLLLELVAVYAARIPRVDARAKLAQFEAHLDETWFAWRGGHSDSSAFYYRVYSPVLLIEYDNHPGIFLDNDEPERFHVHTIVREPNGGDYGRDLLKQHYLAHHQPELEHGHHLDDDHGHTPAHDHDHPHDHEEDHS